MKYEKHACLVLTTDTHEMGYATFQTSILRIKKALQAHTEDSDIHEKKKKKILTGTANRILSQPCQYN